MKITRAVMCFGMFCVTLVASSGLVHGQEKYPSRPITLVVPTPPGGGTDVVARRLQAIVEPILGVPVVVRNMPGAGGVVGTAYVADAKPDGYTLALTFNGALTTIPSTKRVPYKTDSYVPIMQVGSSFYAMCVAPTFPANTGREFLEELRRNPNKYTYGNDGAGGNMHLAAERIFSKFAVKARAVPLGGAGETARFFLGGHIDIYGGSVPPIMPYVTAGTAKCLLLTSANDKATLPQASGLAALGAAELETGFWYVIVGPKDLPLEIVKTLHWEKPSSRHHSRRRWTN